MEWVIMQNDGLDEAETGIKIARRNINNLRYAGDTTLMAESEEELKSLFMKVKEESDSLESPLDCKESQPVHSEEDQPWVCFGRNDAKAETPILWPPHATS